MAAIHVEKFVEAEKKSVLGAFDQRVDVELGTADEMMRAAFTFVQFDFVLVHGGFGAARPEVRPYLNKTRCSSASDTCYSWGFVVKSSAALRRSALWLARFSRRLRTQGGSGASPAMMQPCG